MQTGFELLSADLSSGRHDPSSIIHDQGCSRRIRVMENTIQVVRDMIRSTLWRYERWVTGSELLKADLSSERHDPSRIRHDQGYARRIQIVADTIQTVNDTI